VQIRNKLWRSIAHYSSSTQVEEVDVASSRWNRARQWVFLLLTNQSSSPLAYAISVFVNAAILLSTCSFIYSTIPHYRAKRARNPWAIIPLSVWLIETVCSIIFSVEFVVHMAVIPRLASLQHHPAIIINFLALLPWYTARIVGDDFRVISVLRCTRLLTMFRATKQLVSLLGGTVQRAANMLLLLVCVTANGICMIGSALYAAEAGKWDPIRQIFVQTISYSCRVPCLGPDEFGTYAGCRDASDYVSIEVHRDFGAVADDCVPNQVCGLLIGSLQAAHSHCGCVALSSGKQVV
jgi:hypothetical protein